MFPELANIRGAEAIGCLGDEDEAGARQDEATKALQNPRPKLLPQLHATPCPRGITFPVSEGHDDDLLFIGASET